MFRFDAVRRNPHNLRALISRLRLSKQKSLKKGVVSFNWIKNNPKRFQAYFLILFFIVSFLTASIQGILHHTAEEARKPLLKALYEARTEHLETEKLQAETQSQLDAKNAILKAQDAHIKDIESQLQAKAERKQQNVAYAASIPAQAPNPPITVAGCGDNPYATYIYQHESGCNLNAVNAGGCRGIGQACPGSKLPCGADYACQNAFFTAYANSAYGGWYPAYLAWLSKHWW